MLREREWSLKYTGLYQIKPHYADEVYALSPVQDITQIMKRINAGKKQQQSRSKYGNQWAFSIKALNKTSCGVINTQYQKMSLICSAYLLLR